MDVLREGRVAEVQEPGQGRTVLAVAIDRTAEGGTQPVEDVVAVEEPLEIQLIYSPEVSGGFKAPRQRRSLAVTMRTPGNDAELAAGFLLTEGVVHEVGDILAVRESSDIENAEAGSMQRNTVCVELAEDVAVNLSTLERNFYTTSSCGICGKASLLAIRSVCPPRRANDLVLSAEMIYELPARLRASQQVFEATGGLHGAALFHPSGEIDLLREDVGRHNAVDKLCGAKLFLDEIPIREKGLLLSGRVSFELLQKAVMAGIPAVVAIGAPSSLAVQVAREFDVTLVAFLRNHRFNIYHGSDRIRF